jgi:hypothetical protein
MHGSPVLQQEVDDLQGANFASEDEGRRFHLSAGMYICTAIQKKLYLLDFLTEDTSLERGESIAQGWVLDRAPCSVRISALCDHHRGRNG